MSVVVVGINHKSAPLSLRERLSFSIDDIAPSLEALLSAEAASEVVILSTCNRTEIIAHTDNANALLHWLASTCTVPIEDILPHWYCYAGAKAVTHLMQVASGLDSMIVGEPQIFGQMKAAFVKACNVGTVGSQIDRLFQRVFNVAKKVRTSTSIGACPVSLASTIVKLADRTLDCLQDKTLLVIGAGDTAAMIAKRFLSAGVTDIVIANRTLYKAQSLAAEISGCAVTIPNMAQHLARAHIVVTATTSLEPIVTVGMIAAAYAASVRPALIVDVGVPRNVESKVIEHRNVSLYSIDDLSVLLQDSQLGREHAAIKAKEMIADEVRHYDRWLQSLEAASAIHAYRQHVTRVQEVECEKAKHLLAKGVPPEEVISRLAHALCNKLMHKPSVKIRKAGYDGRLDMVELAQEIFGIE